MEMSLSVPSVKSVVMPFWLRLAAPSEHEFRKRTDMCLMHSPNVFVSALTAGSLEKIWP